MTYFDDFLVIFTFKLYNLIAALHMLDAYSRAWVWFGREHADLPRRIAIRTGNLFKFKNN